jgi:hypothetical protein
MTYIVYRYLDHLNKFKYVFRFSSEIEAKKECKFLERKGIKTKIIVKI